MPNWPLNNKNLTIPRTGDRGAFWENRDDRFHCGIDLYVENGSDIFAIESGKVVEIGVMTSPDFIHYWNVTYYVIVENKDKTFWKYGEMENYFVNEGDFIKGGTIVGQVGLVLNSVKINNNSPKYIQKLKDKNPSMLHLELYSKDPIGTHENYLGGNWFSNQRPKHLENPTEKLLAIQKKILKK